MNTTVWLLFNDKFEVLWSFNEASMQELVDKHPDSFILPKIIESTLPDNINLKLLGKDGSWYFDEQKKFHDIPESFYQTKMLMWYNPNYFTNQLRERYGFGVWILFDRQGKACYSFAKSKVQKTYDSFHHHYLCAPIWIPLQLIVVVRLYAYHEWLIIHNE